jgi:hypothetical protein
VTRHREPGRDPKGTNAAYPSGRPFSYAGSKSSCPGFVAKIISVLEVKNR